jgi:hypothetical protein
MAYSQALILSSSLDRKAHPEPNGRREPGARDGEQTQAGAIVADAAGSGRRRRKRGWRLAKTIQHRRDHQGHGYVERPASG